jgi:hypothetical protein
MSQLTEFIGKEISTKYNLYPIAQNSTEEVYHCSKWNFEEKDPLIVVPGIIMTTPPFVTYTKNAIDCRATNVELSLWHPLTDRLRTTDEIVKELMNSFGSAVFYEGGPDCLQLIRYIVHIYPFGEAGFVRLRFWLYPQTIEAEERKKLRLAQNIQFPEDATFEDMIRLSAQLSV